jgi:hypothetical protein
LQATLGAAAYSPAQVKEWVRPSETHDYPCQDHSRPARHSSDLAEHLRDFLEEFSFASRKCLARQLIAPRGDVIRVVHDDLGLQNYAKQWIPHDLTEARKPVRGRPSSSLPECLHAPRIQNSRARRREASHGFIIDTETLHVCLSREEVPSMKPNTTGTSRGTIAASLGTRASLTPMKDSLRIT